MPALRQAHRSTRNEVGLRPLPGHAAASESRYDVRMGAGDSVQVLTPLDFQWNPVLREIGASSRGWSMLTICPIRRLQTHDILLHAGQANDRMYFVLDGLLSVRLLSDTSEVLSMIEPGGTVGELSVIDQKPATAYVVAEKPTRLLTVTGEFFWKLVGAFPSFSEHILTSIAGHARRSNGSLARSLDENAQLEVNALVDSLTGVYNRRWLTDRGERLLSRAQADGSAFSLFVADIDHFKRFNDTCGHPAGDAVLAAVARGLTASLRPSDFVVRYGGEEFIALLPATTLEEARDVAERTRLTVSLLEVFGIDGAVLPQVTISVGVAARGNEGEISQLISRADALLYAAKQNGRNRVEAAGG
jgi:diguanylate cyclase (GGDEF)-like protein